MMNNGAPMLHTTYQYSPCDPRYVSPDRYLPDWAGCLRDDEIVEAETMTELAESALVAMIPGLDISHEADGVVLMEHPELILGYVAWGEDGLLELLSLIGEDPSIDMLHRHACSFEGLAVFRALSHRGRCTAGLVRSVSYQLLADSGEVAERDLTKIIVDANTLMIECGWTRKGKYLCN